MGIGAFAVASGELGELIPKICAKIQITLSEHHASSHRWVKDIPINLVVYSSRLMIYRSWSFSTVRRMFTLEQNVVQINLMPLKNDWQLNYQ